MLAMCSMSYHPDGDLIIKENGHSDKTCDYYFLIRSESVQQSSWFRNRMRQKDPVCGIPSSDVSMIANQGIERLHRGSQLLLFIPYRSRSLSCPRYFESSRLLAVRLSFEL